MKRILLTSWTVLWPDEPIELLHVLCSITNQSDNATAYANSRNLLQSCCLANVKNSLHSLIQCMLGEASRQKMYPITMKTLAEIQAVTKSIFDVNA